MTKDKPTYQMPFIAALLMLAAVSFFSLFMIDRMDASLKAAQDRDIWLLEYSMAPEQLQTHKDRIALIEKAENFYERRWTALLAFTGMALAVVGLIVPMLISWYQRQQFMRDETEVTNRIQTQADKQQEQFVDLGKGVMLARGDAADATVSIYTLAISTLLAEPERLQPLVNGMLYSLAKMCYCYYSHGSYDTINIRVSETYNFLGGNYLATSKQAIGGINDVMPMLMAGAGRNIPQETIEMLGSFLPARSAKAEAQN